MWLEIGFGSWPKWMLFPGKQFMKALEKNLAVWARRVRNEANEVCRELQEATAGLMRTRKALEAAKERSGHSRRRFKATKGRGREGASRKGRKGR